ncbi:MAG: hypothetical protein IPM48_02815 [Saprospiraceae bacterium]|nr:hypothetical protein [Saprospiraceae bacterium]
MKNVNLTLSSLFKKGLGFCVFMFAVVSISTTDLNAQTTYGLPNLKSVAQATQDLQLAFDVLYPQAKQNGQNSQEFITAQLYKRLLDALTNRPDPNMDTYSVLISNIDVNHYGSMVVRNGNAVNLDATIHNVLRTPEYQSLVNVVKL